MGYKDICDMFALQTHNKTNIQIPTPESNWFSNGLRTAMCVNRLGTDAPAPAAGAAAP